MVNPTGYRRGTRDMFSQHTKRREFNIYPHTLEPTKVVTSLISRVMVPSKRVCPTNPTMAKLVAFSTFPSTPSVSLSTKGSKDVFFPKRFQSGLNTLNTAPAVKTSWIVSKRTKSSKMKPKLPANPLQNVKDLLKNP